MMIAALTVMAAKGSSDPPNLIPLECSLHKLAYEFGTSKVHDQNCYKSYDVFANALKNNAHIQSIGAIRGCIPA